MFIRWKTLCEITFLPMNRQLEKTRSTETCLTGLIGSTANQQKLREGYVFSVLTYNFFFSFLVVLKRIISDSFSKSSLGSSSTNTVSVFRLLWMLIPFFTLSSSFPPIQLSGAGQSCRRKLREGKAGRGTMNAHLSFLIVLTCAIVLSLQ